MQIYLIGYLLIFLGIILSEKTYPKCRSLYFIGLIYAAIIVIFRGNVGTDTGNYEAIISNISFSNWLNQPTEIGFNFLVAMFKQVILSDPIILRILTALYILSLLLLLTITEGNIRKYILIYFIPACIYTSSMNGLRVGFAINFIVIAINYFNKKQLISLACFMLAVGFHVSTIIIVPIILIFQKNNSRKIILLLFASLLMVLIFIIYKEHITNKIILYSSSSKVLSTSSSSGLSFLIVFTLMLPFYYFYTDKKTYKIKFILISTSLIFLSFIIAKFSYAGLRILSLYLLLLPIVFIYISDTRKEKTQNLRLPSVCFWSLYIASFANTLFTLRNFTSTQGQEYGFIPYYFIFN